MDWKLQRARRCNRPPVPARAASAPLCRLCRGARDPNGATGGCDGPEAARHVAARRSVPRPADGTRGRSDGNHVSTLVSSPSWCVSSAAGSSDNHARCSVFSPSLSISLYLSFSPPASPSPPSPAPPFYRAFFIFFSPRWFPPSLLHVFANCRHQRGWPTTSRARRPCAAIVEELLPLARSYVTARRLAPRPVCALNTDRVNCG